MKSCKNTLNEKKCEDYEHKYATQVEEEKENQKIFSLGQFPVVIFLFYIISFIPVLSLNDLAASSWPFYYYWPEFFFSSLFCACGLLHHCQCRYHKVQESRQVNDKDKSVGQLQQLKTLFWRSLLLRNSMSVIEGK